MTDGYSTKFTENLIATKLSLAGLEEDRCSLLSSPRRCLEAMQRGDANWDVFVALCVHIDWDLTNLRTSSIDWQAEASEPVFKAVAETALSQPTFIGEYRYREVPFDASVSRHIHSRVAASLLIQNDQPALALQFLESISEILPPKTLARLPLDLSWEFVERVRRHLQQLYEQSGDYRLALQMHGLRSRWGDPARHYAIAEVYLNQWTLGLKGGTTVLEAKAILDASYGLLIDSDRVDEEDRDSLGDAPRDTRQFWAWFYGRTVGLLKIEHPYLKDALLHELGASDWVEGWAAASMLIEEHLDWMAHRGTCMTLYRASDIEYKGARPWNARQPAHLSPSSDLYWAMRVGYCDAHIEPGREITGLSTADISAQIEDLRQIVSSAGLRAIRSNEEVMQGIASLTRAIPTEEAARKSLEDDIGNEVLNALPAAIVKHLVAAWLARLQGRPDDARVATVKGIEAVFTRLIKPRLHEVVPEVQIHITRPNGTRWTCPLRLMGRIQLAEWSALLPDLALEQGENEILHEALSLAFPSIDWNLLSRCSMALMDAANARGQSAHDADRESYSLALVEVDRLWSIAVGSLTTPGLIPTFLTALGIDTFREQ